jgi:predicted DNA-binding helix-hairpin-helix protein
MSSGWRVVALLFLSGMSLQVWGFAGEDLSWWKNTRPSSRPNQAQKILVDVNEGALPELMRIPGMTSVWAGRIVRFRPYSSKYALKLEGVLPADVYERLKQFLVAHREK